MGRFYFILLFSISFCSAFFSGPQLSYGNTYYLSTSSGNDARLASEAQSQNTPWKTIAKLNSLNILQPGDSVLFRRGETFFGSLVVSSRGSSARPIVFGAYGTGNKPVITTMLALTQWTQAGIGIFESTIEVQGEELNRVVINGNAYAVGRYPNRDEDNGGYLRVETHTGKTSIQSTALKNIADFTGAEVVIRKNHWVIDRHRIISQVGTSISYDNNNSVYEATNQFGFFVQRHIKTLDEFGEWYFSGTGKKLSIFFGNTNPRNVRVEVSVYKNVIQTVQNSGLDVHVVFDGLNLRGSNESAVLLNFGNNITVKNCDIDFAGKNGIEANGVKNLSVTGCSIKNSYNSGVISIWDNTNTLLENNVIDSTSLYPGMVQSGDGNGLGIFCVGKNSIIRGNKITNTGYVGINFGGDGVQVVNNLIDKFCVIKDDGSGIYTYTGAENRKYTGRRIANNIVLNGIGAQGGSESGYVAAEGIYLDDNVTGVDITGNTIAHIANAGLYIHNARELNIWNNLIYDAKTQLRLSHDGLGDPISSVNINGNTFFARSAGQGLVDMTTIKNDLGNMARLDSNNYARPLANTGAFVQTKFFDNGSEVSADFDLAKWKTDWGQDRASQKCTATFPAIKSILTVGNNKISDGSFDRSITGVEAWSPTNRVKLNWSASRTLEVVASGLAYTMVPAGAVNSSKSYVLKFDQVSNKPNSVNVYIRQHHAPYKTISDVLSFSTTAASGKIQMVFKPSADEADCVLVLETKDNDVVYALDNIELTESVVELTDPDNFIRFEYNNSDNVKNVVLGGVYLTPANQIASGTKSIASYRSAIYVWKENLVTVSPPQVLCDDKNNTITATHSMYNREIIVSENDGPYQAYTGIINVGNLSRPPGYWKFKISASETHSESETSASTKFTQEVMAAPATPILAIYPNPASSFSSFSITNDAAGTGSIAFYSMKGIKVLEMPIVKSSKEFVKTINVSFLHPGLYIVVWRINGNISVGKLFKV